ncbi:PREDICTED: CENP-B homolog protein 2-like [Camelina sativa]|uniref:CENP-B homolog protein 2-like n=1 Tax=Camelina sativa TaxID=90675 RepID=A0ABM0T162_CAMSA|nr:PREDICTED: CENP-B homolog protein 2-like [Camelina sativa]
MASHLKGVAKATMTDQIRKELCEYKRDHTKCTQKELQLWIQEKFQIQVSQGTISNTLKRSDEYLSTNLESRKDIKRHKPAKYPEMEKVLFEWFLQYQDRVNMTGELILEKAKVTMKLVYPEQDFEHQFSQGWLEKFKLRHGIKSFRRFGESGSVDVEDMEKKLEAIRGKIDKFSKKDVFNMDETGLFYRLQADHSLATKQLEGKKQDKERLTVVICCNEDGSEKIPLWIIGKYAKPRCFKNVNMNSLNCHYRANKRAWMTSVIFEEYIRWFDQIMHGRRVLFVVDNCPAHPRNIEGLHNVELFFLPPNMTSKIQPCDAGIIRAFKMHYRRRFYREVLEGYELGQSDPAKINVLHAINFAVSAWTTNVHGETIANCFRHCKIRSRDAVSRNSEEESVCEDGMQELEVVINNLSYRNKMDVNSLLDYPGENDACSEVQSLEEIVASVINVDEEAEDDNVEPLEPVTRKEAIIASRTLHNFWMQIEKTTPGVFDAIRKIRDELQRDSNFKKRQTTLDSYFTKLS